MEVSERFVDGLAVAQELAQASQAACDATSGPFDDSPRGQLGAHLHAAMAAWWASDVSLADFAEEAANRAFGATVCDPDDPEVEEVAQAALLRDIFGPLSFRPLLPIAPALLAQNDGLVVKLAQAAYEERSLPAGTLNPARLAVLADALVDAGCANEEILGHCREQTIHVRGCWLLDLLLNRE